MTEIKTKMSRLDDEHETLQDAHQRALRRIKTLEE
jgi:hypothetical protein